MGGEELPGLNDRIAGIVTLAVIVGLFLVVRYFQGRR